MKAIVFDVDNTLIDWKDEFLFALSNLLKELYPDITKEKILEVDKIIEESEGKLEILNEKIFLEYLKNKCNIILPDDFVTKLIYYQGDCAYEDEEVFDTIEYLSKKYDLYVITNWFTKTQRMRLEKMNIAKFFKDIIGADINYLKPDKRVFDILLKHYDKKDIVYVGDNFNFDILPTINNGIRAIWKTKTKHSNYETIEKIVELKNIF